MFVAMRRTTTSRKKISLFSLTNLTIKKEEGKRNNFEKLLNCDSVKSCSLMLSKTKHTRSKTHAY